jgi:hypothetical protein
MRFLAGLLVAVVTDALVSSHHVLTDTVGADAASTGTFVDILKIFQNCIVGIKMK